MPLEHAVCSALAECARRVGHVARPSLAAAAGCCPARRAKPGIARSGSQIGGRKKVLVRSGSAGTLHAVCIGGCGMEDSLSVIVLATAGGCAQGQLHSPDAQNPV